MFIIFLGILPAILISLFIYHYIKPNLRKFGGKQSAPSVTYVNDCFLWFQHVLSACKESSLWSRHRLPTISAKVPFNNKLNNIHNVEITQTGLISTTNTDGIVRSNTITNCSKSSFKTISSLKLNNPKTCDTPNTTENVVRETPANLSVKHLVEKFGVNNSCET